MPGTFALKDGDRELLKDAITVSGDARAVVLTGDDTTRLFVGMQVAALTVTLEKLLDRLGRIAEAYEAGWRDREAVCEARTAPTLRLVAT
jgi:phosphopantetheine adenylyltransferase